MTSGVMLAQSGIRAVSYLSAARMPRSESYEALIISTNSRNLPPRQAQQRVRDTYRALASHGAVHFTKRIDTTYRGGIGVEIDALLDEIGDDHTAIVANTLSASKRITVGGYALIDGQALSETDAARDVLSPVRESHIPTLLASQSTRQVGEIHLGCVLAGRSELQRAIDRQSHAGSRIIVIDAITTAHVRAIAQAVTDMDLAVVCVDSGALTQQMAICRGLGSADRLPVRSPRLASIADARHRVLVVAGSATELTRQQIGKLAKEKGVQIVSISPQELLDDEMRATAIRGGVRKIRDALARSAAQVVVVETAVSSMRIDLSSIETARKMTRGSSSARLTSGLASIVREVLSDQRIADDLCGISMTGGDTLFAVLKAIGAEGIRFIDSVQPQANLGAIVGGPHDGLRIVGKGGMVGDDETAKRIVTRLILEDVCGGIRVGASK